jgi:hypothetical protein
MTITEIALLRMVLGVTTADANLRSNLAHAKEVMQNYTGNTFYYFQQTEDPSYIYVIGEWQSLDQHLDQFIPSAENKLLLDLLKDQLTVEWLLHADVSHSDLSLPKTRAEMNNEHEREAVISLRRYFVKDGQKENFQASFNANKSYLQDFTTGGTVAGGWRIDKEDGKEEWFQICPCISVEQHFEFTKTEGFQKYAHAEIKHAKFLDI